MKIEYPIFQNNIKECDKIEQNIYPDFNSAKDSVLNKALSILNITDAQERLINEV